jgi:hypothetical protein
LGYFHILAAHHYYTAFYLQLFVDEKLHLCFSESEELKALLKKASFKDVTTLTGK